MTEPIPLATAKKSVLGHQSNRLKKTEQKERIQLGFNIKLNTAFFSLNTKTVSLTVSKQ